MVFDFFSKGAVVIHKGVIKKIKKTLMLEPRGKDANREQFLPFLTHSILLFFTFM